MVAGLAIGLFMQHDKGGPTSFIWFILMTLSMILYPFGMSGLGFVSNNIFPDLTDVDELITGRRREGVISTFSTLIKKSIAGVMAALVAFTLDDFGLVTGDKVSQYEKATGQLYTQSASAVIGVRVCVAIVPIAAALISLILLKKFKMTKDDHALIRAAVAAKHKYGAVNLTPEQKERCELISGQKLENTWLGKDNDSPDAYTLETNENGEYLILIEKELEKDLGLYVISGPDTIIPESGSRKYGLYRTDDQGNVKGIAAPITHWGRFYTAIIQSILDGTYNEREKTDKTQPLNYWFGIRTGAVDVIFSDELPYYSRKMIRLLRQAVIDGTADPFRGELHSQTRQISEEGAHTLSYEQIIGMDWLNDNIIGEIPRASEMQDSIQKTLMTSGVAEVIVPDGGNNV